MFECVLRLWNWNVSSLDNGVMRGVWTAALSRRMECKCISERDNILSTGRRRGGESVFAILHRASSMQFAVLAAAGIFGVAQCKYSMRHSVSGFKCIVMHFAMKSKVRKFLELTWVSYFANISASVGGSNNRCNKNNDMTNDWWCQREF